MKTLSPWSTLRRWGGVVGALAALACLAGFKPKPAASPMPVQATYVDAVELPVRVVEKQPFELTVRGNLPNPAWELNPVVVKVKGHTLTVDLKARRVTDRAVAEMLVPYEQVVKVPGLEAGDWTVVVPNHGGPAVTQDLCVEKK